MRSILCVVLGRADALSEVLADPLATLKEAGLTGRRGVNPANPSPHRPGSYRGVFVFEDAGD
jgi:hypothetical protein